MCTLNAARILDAACRILGKTHDEVGQLAVLAKPGANGLTLLPYFEGERTPNRPDATGVFAGMNLKNSNPEDIARAMVEGMLAGLADAVDSLVGLGVRSPSKYGSRVKSLAPGIAASASCPTSS